MLADSDQLNFDKKTDVNQLLFINILLTIINHHNTKAYLHVLDYASSKGDFEMAYYYLEELLENGYKNADEINSYKGIEMLRIMPQYRDILKQYGLKTPY